MFQKYIINILKDSTMRKLLLLTILFLGLTSCGDGDLSKVSKINKDNLNVNPYEQETNTNSNNAMFSASLVSYEQQPKAVKTKCNNYIASFYPRFVGNRNDKLNYIQRFLPTAIAQYERYGIPVAFNMAQAILESGSDSHKATVYNNHFGIKCKGDANYGEIDCVNGFAVYETAWHGWNSHSRFLTERKYYSHVMAECDNDSDCWAKTVGPIYCPDDGYVEALFAVMDSYDLRKYDDYDYSSKYNLPNRTNVSPQAIQKGEFLPIGNYTYLLNPSHGKNTKGKRATFKTKLDNGEYTIYEWVLNRKVTERLERRCKELNIPYKILVSEDRDISRKTRIKRANDYEKKIGSTILVTVDHNAAPYNNSNEPSISENYDFEDENEVQPYVGRGVQVASGMEAFHYANNSRTKHFLEVLGQNVEKRLPGWYKRGTKTARFDTIVKTKMPSVTLECGFFDNQDEANFLNSDFYLINMTESIIETFCQFNGKKYIPSAKL